MGRRVCPSLLVSVAALGVHGGPRWQVREEAVDTGSEWGEGPRSPARSSRAISSQLAPAALRPTCWRPGRLRQPLGDTACEQMLAKRQEEATSQEGLWGADWVVGRSRGLWARKGLSPHTCTPQLGGGQCQGVPGPALPGPGPPTLPPALPSGLPSRLPGSAPPLSARPLRAPLCPLKQRLSPFPSKQGRPGGSCLYPGLGRRACWSFCSDKGQTPPAGRPLIYNVPSHD